MRAFAVKAASTWSGETADRVILDYDERHRRRVAMTGTKGLAFLLDLPTASGLRPSRVAWRPVRTKRPRG